MSGTTDELRRLTQAVLDKLKERQQTIERSIAILENDLSRPPFVSHIDFEVTKEEARKDNEFLDKCKRKRLQGGEQ